MVDPGEMSPSKLAAFYNCPRYYFFQYVQHLRVPDSVYLAFGKSIHYMLRLLYEKNWKSEETFARFFKGQWYRRCYPELPDRKGLDFSHTRNDIVFHDPSKDPHMFANIGMDILRRFHRDYAGKPPQEHEKSFHLDFEGHRITGRFDRIDVEDSVPIITDYKTDMKSPEQNDFLLRRAPQFTLYMHAEWSIGGVKPRFYYHHLRSGRRFETERTDDDFKYLREILDEARDRIKNNMFTQHYGFRCNFCPYQVPCGVAPVTRLAPEEHMPQELTLFDNE